MLCSFFFFKQKTAYEMRISDWSSDVCSSDLEQHFQLHMTLKPGKILPHVKTDGYGGILPATLAKELRDRVGKPFVIDASSYEERVLIDLQLPEGVLSVVAPGERLFRSTTYIFILWMVGTSLALFAVASIFIDRKSTRLNSRH